MLNKTRKNKRKKWPIVLAIVVIALIAASAAIFMQLRGRIADAISAIGVMSAEASVGGISETVTGTGSLSGVSSREIKLPAGLVVDEVLFESGDAVSEGDTIAVINKKSIADKIAETQSEIEALDEQIESVKSDTESETIVSSVSGRVKMVYIAEGEGIVDRMLESQALMLISLDGYMAVDVPAGGLSEGDSVTVTREDGTRVSGTVRKITGNTAAVTVTDNGPRLGEAVTVKDSSGGELGSGALYINKPLAVSGTYGTAGTVHVSENTKVYSGTKLITLTGVSDSAEYLGYVEDREELLATLQTLFLLSKSGVLTAPFSGTVETLYMEDGSTIGSFTGSDSATNGGGDTGGSSTPDYSSLFLSANGAESESGIMLLTNETEILTLINDLPLTAPVTGGAAQSEITAERYTGKVKWEPGDSIFMPETAYTAFVELTASTGCEFAGDIKIEFPGHEEYVAADILLADGVLSFTVAFPATESFTGGSGGPADGDNQGGSNIGGGYPNLGSYSVGGTGSYGGLDDAGGQTDGSLPAQTESVALTITPDDYMLLKMSVDELDILSVEVGQQAVVTLDAIENETYSGAISKVNYSASSSGGVTKYTVEIAIPKTAGMLTGMNASATIVISEKSGILTIPAAAIQEEFGRTFVYTARGETGILSGEVDITTGISNGSLVEVVSGLSAGDTVYYQMNIGDSVIGQGAFSMGGGSMRQSSGQGPQYVESGEFRQAPAG